MKNKKFRDIIMYLVLFSIIVSLLLIAHSIPTVIIIQSSGFEPNDTGIYPGTVIWVNNDSKVHRIISNSGVFDSGDLNPGQNYAYDFSWHDTGYYHYHDTINTSMKGRIQVEMVDGRG